MKNHSRVYPFPRGAARPSLPDLPRLPDLPDLPDVPALPGVGATLNPVPPTSLAELLTGGGS